MKISYISEAVSHVAIHSCLLVSIVLRFDKVVILLERFKMNNQVIWLCLSLIASLFSSSSSLFFSCPSSYYTSEYTFDCSFLGEHISHRNYLDTYVPEACKIEKFKTTITTTLSSTANVVLKNCRLPTLPHEFLQRFEHVNDIVLDNSEIKSINEKTFPKGWGLLELSMSSNDISELPEFVFSKMSNISKINLQLNRIHNIDPNAFNGTTKLKTINLSRNIIEVIPESTFSDAINLEVLDLSYNFIEHFLVNLSKSKNLNKLRLDNNKIDVLDCNVFDLSTNKIVIDASFNQIRNIDLNCDVHIEFFELSLYCNQLTSLIFPKSNLLNGLTKIDASVNRIKNIRFDRVFSKLVEIDLGDNNLKELHGWDVTMFPKLRAVDISGNWFNCTYLDAFLKSKLPMHVLKMSKLKEVGPRKNIHGINCIDDNQSAYARQSLNSVVAYGNGSEINVEHIIMWCLLASSTVLQHM